MLSAIDDDQKNFCLFAELGRSSLPLPEDPNPRYETFYRIFGMCFQESSIITVSDKSIPKSNASINSFFVPWENPQV